MRFEVATILALAAFMAYGDGAEPAVEQDQGVDPELEAEFAYVNALVDRNYVDIAAPVIEATKKRWPESEARFFAIEIRSALALNKFDEAEKKIAALPDRNSDKYWAAKLEFANRYNTLKREKECRAIYDEFFKVYAAKSGKDKAWAKSMRTFYIQACFSWGQILVLNHNREEAVNVYKGLLGIKPPLSSQQWCMMACETIDLYLQLVNAQTNEKKRNAYLDDSEKLANEVIKHPEEAIFFGRAVNMKSHIELLRGRFDRAKGIIEDYLPQLSDLHNSIVAKDPTGSKGLLRLSPMPQCRYLLAKLLWDEAQNEAKKPKKNDEAIKALMFGAKQKNGKRDGQGAYNHALNVFLRYPESTWASKAGELADEIKAYAENTYGAKIKSQVTPEMVAKVRAMQFRVPADKLAEGNFEEAVKEYLDVLSRYPETEDSISAIESLIGCYHDLMATDAAHADAWRLDADAVEGYLGERFAGNANRALMLLAGDATLRVAKFEKERGDAARCNALRREFILNYCNHASAAQTAAGMAGEAKEAGKIAEAIDLWNIVANNYSNSIYYATAYLQIAQCQKELGNRDAAIEAMLKYAEVEQNLLHKMQGQTALAQLYRDIGLELLTSASTNATPEAVAAQESRGTAQLVRAIQQFTNFSKKAAEEAKNPSISKEEAVEFSSIAEAASFLVAECWSRMTRPADKVESFRKNAAKGYEAYLAAYPDGKWTKIGYVKLSTIYSALGDVEKSRLALDALSRKFPDSDEARDAKPKLAKSLIEIGMQKEGTAIYAEMLGTDGKYTDLQFLNAGEALIDSKNWELAGQAFHKAIALAGTNHQYIVAKAMVGQAKSAWKQKSFTEAREVIDNFLADAKLSKMALAADVNFMLVDIASEQGRMEKDSGLRNRYFGEAIGALKKVRQYWARTKPQWEQDQLDLLSGDVLIDRMKAEEAMNLKDDALNTCGRAASTFQAFIQSHGVDAEHPLEKMAEGEVNNLERAYASLVPLLSKLGPAQADQVIRFGSEYLRIFPNGKSLTEINNCINQAKAVLPAKKSS